MVTLILPYTFFIVNFLGTLGALFLIFFFLHALLQILKHYNCPCGLKDKLLQYLSQYCGHTSNNLSVLFPNCFLPWIIVSFV